MISIDKGANSRIHNSLNEALTPSNSTKLQKEEPKQILLMPIALNPNFYPSSSSQAVPDSKACGQNEKQSFDLHSCLESFDKLKASNVKKTNGGSGELDCCPKDAIASVSDVMYENRFELPATPVKDCSHEETTNAIKEPSLHNHSKADRSDEEEDDGKNGDFKKEENKETSGQKKIPMSLNEKTETQGTTEKKARTTFKKANEVLEATKNFFSCDWRAEPLQKYDTGIFVKFYLNRSKINSCSLLALHWKSIFSFKNT